MRREIIALYDEYTHAPLDRRVFLDRLAKLAGGTSAALALLPLLENNYAQAAVVPADDERLTIETVEFEAPGGRMSAYVARPTGTDPLPAVIVIHENRGLNPHTQDVVRRTALAGFVAIGPDFLSSEGGTPADEDQARSLINGLDDGTTLENALAAVRYARSRPDTTERVGVMGFCWGGGLVNRIAAAEPELDAAVSFYGRQVPAEQAGGIEAPLMLHYAGLDERINAGIPAFQEALDSGGVDYELFVYDGVEHAFVNDTNAARYDEAAARLAWERTTAFLNQHLQG